MSLNFWKKILFVIWTILAFAGMVQIALKSTGESYDYQAFAENNASTIGIINNSNSYSHTVTITEDFEGIAFLVGTYDATQYGVMRVTVTNDRTGDVVLDQSRWMSLMKDNSLACFAADETIPVGDGDSYTITIEGRYVFGDNGVTVWMEEDGSWCCGTVTSYGSALRWGIFIRRMELFVLLYLFVAIHCFVRLSSLYEQIFQKRVWIALALLVFLVANKINFSSLNQFDTYVQPGEGSEYVEPLFGKSRSIRSDEWLVNVPRALSAEYSDYGRYNSIVRATETTNLSASGLYRSFSALASPADWGYYLLGSEYGLSFYWCFRFLFGFLFSFELCLILSRGKRMLALMGGSMIWFSSFSMWWSGVTWIWTGEAALVCFYYFLMRRRWWKKLFWGIATAIFASNFIVALYPAWQVPAGYVFAAILLWMIIDRRKLWMKFSWYEWLIGVCSVGFMCAVTACYFYNYMDYIEAIMATAYPGNRVVYGGFAIDKLLGYIPTLLYPYMHTENASELSCFYGLFPLSAVLFVIVLVKKRGRDVLMWALLLPSALMAAYCITELPQWLATVSLMTYSMPKRVADVLGYVNVLMLVIALSRMEKKEKLSKFVGALLSVLSAAAALYAARGCFADKKVFVACVVSAAGIAILSWLLVTDSGKSRLACAMISVVLIVTGLSVNPVMCGVDAITSKPVAEEVQALVAQDADAKWIATDTIVNADYLIALGAPTINSTNYIPNMELWALFDPTGGQEEIYNRYAHFGITLTDGETTMELRQTDVVWLYLSYADLGKLGVDYILSVSKLDAGEQASLALEYEHSGLYIYRVSGN